MNLCQLGLQYRISAPCSMNCAIVSRFFIYFGCTDMREEQSQPTSQKVASQVPQAFSVERLVFETIGGSTNDLLWHFFEEYQTGGYCCALD